MKKSTNNTSGGIGFCSLLGIAFIILKLTGFINWSWVWVLAPIWIPLALLIAGVLILAVTEFVGKD